MSYSYDDQLIEATLVRRRRLVAALLFGGDRVRRTAPDAQRLLLAGAFIAALACAACVGASFVMHLLATDPTLHQSPRPVVSQAGRVR